MPNFFHLNNKTLGIARDAKAFLTGKKRERQEFKQRQSKIRELHATNTSKDREKIKKLWKEGIRQRQAVFESEKGTLPDFVIIGAKKCGTSFLYHLLTQHPYIESAAQKELRYFDRLFEEEGIEWYRRCFPPPKWKDGYRTITGEATPYLAHPHAAERMAKVVPQARLIVLLRNPVDRAYSDYQQASREGKENLTFEEAIEAENRWLLVKDDIAERGDRAALAGMRRISGKKYLRRGIYVDQLLRWSKYFSKEQLLVLKSEDFFDHTSDTLNLVLKFLDLSPTKNPTLQILSRTKSNKGWYQQGMNPVIRQRLEEYFKPHNRRLYEYLDVDFGW